VKQIKDTIENDLKSQHEQEKKVHEVELKKTAEE
jgi:hypothetical protein